MPSRTPQLGKRPICSKGTDNDGTCLILRGNGLPTFLCPEGESNSSNISFSYCIITQRYVRSLCFFLFNTNSFYFYLIGSPTGTKAGVRKGLTLIIDLIILILGHEAFYKKSPATFFGMKLLNNVCLILQKVVLSSFEFL